MKFKISSAVTILAFILIGYLMYLKFVEEQEIEPKLLIPAAMLALIGSVLRRRGK
ncbi:MAG: hypothetical protein NXI20_10900 [bacterium]|nr:hypothetical protein [bacterium]